MNEAILRARSLRPIFFERPLVVGETHDLVILTFLVLIVGFMLATAVSGWRLRRRLNSRLNTTFDRKAA